MSSSDRRGDASGKLGAQFPEANVLPHASHPRAAHYTGPVRAVILDWAGTAVDFGCFAPVAVFVEVFRRRGVAITPAEARGPMGLEKRAHIQALAQQPQIAERWQVAVGVPCSEADIDAMYTESLPLQTACVADYAQPIPGVVAAVNALRERGIRIGGTTGYSRPIMEALLPAAARHGYAPDVSVCPSDVPAGRPAPWMAFQAATLLGVYPPAAIIKIGDTVPDIEEGLNAGMWSVGVSATGNELGFTASEADALPAAERAERLAQIERKLLAAGAHAVVASAAQLLEVVAEIEARLARGERP